VDSAQCKSVVGAWNKHKPVVSDFLDDIPDKAHSTNKLGVSINLAARRGWTELVQKHIAADPLAVHQRGLIGYAPLHWPAHNGFVEIVALLLDAGADIEADEYDEDDDRPGPGQVHARSPRCWG